MADSTNPIIVHAKKYFAANEELETVFIDRNDNAGFEIEDKAQSHAEDLGGSRADYVTVTPAHCDLADALEDEDATVDCDGVLSDSGLTDDFAQELTDARKAVITESDRVGAAITKAGETEDPDVLNMLKHGETNADVLAAIDDQLALLDGVVVPVANFTVDHATRTTAQAAAFTDTSTNTPTSWEWDFGDGSTSALQNPSHTYADAGTYDVSLKATNARGENTKVSHNLMTVTAP